MILKEMLLAGCILTGAVSIEQDCVNSRLLKTLISTLQKFSDKDHRDRYTARIKRIRREQNLQVSYLAVTREEKDLIVKAMGLTQGHWFKCPKGELNCF